MKRKLGEPQRLDDDVRRKLHRYAYDLARARGEQNEYACGYADGYVESLEGAVESIDKATR